MIINAWVYIIYCAIFHFLWIANNNSIKYYICIFFSFSFHFLSLLILHLTSNPIQIQQLTLDLNSSSFILYMSICIVHVLDFITRLSLLNITWSHCRILILDIHIFKIWPKYLSVFLQDVYLFIFPCHKDFESTTIILISSVSN